MLFIVKNIHILGIGISFALSLAMAPFCPPVPFMLAEVIVLMPMFGGVVLHGIIGELMGQIDELKKLGTGDKNGFQHVDRNQN